MPTYTEAEISALAAKAGWTVAQTRAALIGTALAGHTVEDLIRALTSALYACLGLPIPTPVTPPGAG